MFIHTYIQGITTPYLPQRCQKNSFFQKHQDETSAERFFLYDAAEAREPSFSHRGMFHRDP